MSVSRSLLKSNNRNYWQSIRAIRKNTYNSTPIVDGIYGNVSIANHFKDKFSLLYNSVKSGKDEIMTLTHRIDISVRDQCDCSDDCNDHCHIVNKFDVDKAIHKLKADKVNEDGLLFSDNFIHGTDLLFSYIAILFSSMIYHGFAPEPFIRASVIPIPKGTKASLSNSDKYRSIAISSLISKIFDHVIIIRQAETLKTSDYQFGFKPQSSTVLCSTMVIETIQYYTENGNRPVYLLLLDASKAFDKVSYDVLFNILLDKCMCPRIVKLLYYMYTHQSCYVNWCNVNSDNFNISNGVKQGGVISPLLFSIYIDNLFVRLRQSGLGCHIGLTYAGSFGYADDVALIAPSLYCLKEMILICEKFATAHSITFNPSKSKLLCFNIDPIKVSRIYLKGQPITVVDNEQHLGNYIATDVHDRNIIDVVSDLYQRSNWLISDFRSCDSITLDSLHMTFCMHMYGCELWNLNSRHIETFKIAWRQIKRRIWRLPPMSHNKIIHKLTNDIDILLEKRILKFVHASLNHKNYVCKMIMLSKLYCINSTIADNYRYLSFKYGFLDQDWYSDINYLLGKVKMKHDRENNVKHLVKIIGELCDIRDNNSTCEYLDTHEICKLIDMISSD